MRAIANQSRAKRGEGLPQWDASKQQFTQQIGYCLDGQKRRVRKALEPRPQLARSLFGSDRSQEGVGTCSIQILTYRLMPWLT